MSNLKTYMLVEFKNGGVHLMKPETLNALLKDFPKMGMDIAGKTPVQLDDDSARRIRDAIVNLIEDKREREIQKCFVLDS